jgi:tetratricopeptide (TPR) repeat protein
MTSKHATRLTALVLTAGIALGATAGADDRSAALRREGYQAIYNLDYDRADELFREAIVADPGDYAAYRGAAAATWQRVLFLRGTLLVDDYAGHIRSTKIVPMPPPPPALASAFHRDLDRAVALAEKAVARHFNDAEPHVGLGAALGLYVWFGTSVEASTWDPGRKARRALYESQLAHKLDPTRKDVGLMLGSNQYMVGGLPGTVRFLASIVGFKGGRAEGLRLLEAAAASPSDLQEEAQFRLILTYTRAGRHAEAVAVVRDMERTHPGNRLLLLEEACALLRNGQAAEAEARLDEGIARLKQETRPLMMGEEGRWHWRRGMARLLTGNLDGAEEDLKRALGADGVRDWVLARVRIEFGKLADVRGNRTKAEDEYRAALAIATRLGDKQAVSEATRLLAQPFARQAAQTQVFCP